MSPLGEVIGVARDLVRRSGVVTILDDALAVGTGRPRTLSPEAVLTGLVALGLMDRPLHLSSATRLLWIELDAAERRSLGICGDAQTRRSFLARYRQLRYCFAKICSVLDPSPYPKNRCLPFAVLEARRRCPDGAEERQARLMGVCNALLEASVGLLDRDELAVFDGSAGLDATPVPLWSRGPSRRRGTCASDPDGSWYVREGDHRGREDDKGRVRGKVAWALEATIVTMATPPGRPAAHPSLAIGLAVDRCGADPGGVGAAVLASVVARGHRAGFLGADRAYSAARPESFHLPVRALGYEPVFDYRVDDLGVRASAGGAVLVEGSWCCPAMPAPLVEATADRRTGRIDDATCAALVSARAPYRLAKKEGPAAGYERWSCPASGDRPKVICPLRPQSATPRDGRTKITEPPEMPPKVCAQSAITIAPDVGARHRQLLPFATEQWQRRYATCRNTIEGMNGYVKDTAHEALGEPGRRRVRGIAPQSLFCAVLLVAANVRRIRAHRQMLETNTATAVNERARRRRVNLAEFAPAG